MPAMTVDKPPWERKAILPLLLIVAAAIFYALGVSRKHREMTQGYELSLVLVARSDIPEGAVLREGLVQEMAIPRRFMETGAFEVRTPSDFTQVAGLLTRIPVPKGNQLVRSALAEGAPATPSPEAGSGSP